VSLKNLELSVVVPVSGSPERILNLGDWFKVSPKIKTNVIFVEDGLSSEMKSYLELQIQKFPSGINVRNLVCNFQNPGSPRNLGLSAVSNGLIAFWDCDDLPNFPEVERSLLNLNSDDWDYICGDFVYLDQRNNMEIKSRFPVKEEFTTSDELALEPGLWRYIFKKNFILGLTFPEIRMGEDQVFLGKAIKPHSKGIYINRIFYKYRINLESQLTHSKKNAMELKYAIEQIENVSSMSKNNYADQMKIKMLLTLILRGELRDSVRAWMKLMDLILFKRQLSKVCSVINSLIFGGRSK
jgi:glycosyltransferase involved in cell wall biosynthesis